VQTRRPAADQAGGQETWRAGPFSAERRRGSQKGEGCAASAVRCAACSRQRGRARVSSAHRTPVRTSGCHACSAPPGRASHGASADCACGAPPAAGRAVRGARSLHKPRMYVRYPPAELALALALPVAAVRARTQATSRPGAAPAAASARCGGVARRRGARLRSDAFPPRPGEAEPGRRQEHARTWDEGARRPASGGPSVRRHQALSGTIDPDPP
jgi:hypothetical protein